MKKNIITVMAAVGMLSTSAYAKVSDFNNLINENIKAQDSLHKEVKENMNLAKQRMNETQAASKITIVESNTGEYTVPSKKLRFKKEIHQHQPSAKKQMDRLATEFKDADSDF